MFFYKRLDHTDHVTFTVDISSATEPHMASKVIALVQSQGTCLFLAPNNRTILGPFLIPDIEDQRV